MDPFLIMASIVVGFTAITAYATAFAKKHLEREVVKLEKKREDTVKKFAVVERRRKSMEGTRKMLGRMREEKKVKVANLAGELEKWESGEMEAEIAAAEAEAAESEVETGIAPEKTEDAVQDEGDVSEEQAQKEEEEGREIKTRFPADQRSFDL